MKHSVTIICTPLEFYTKRDENLFWYWVKQIKSIKKIKGIGHELHLYIPSHTIPNNELLDLIGIFDRYKFNNPDQLKVFMNNDNKEWFD